MRRFCSFSSWGLFDVTDWPFCVPLAETYALDVWYDNTVYDGTQ